MTWPNAPSFGTEQDKATLQNPTRSKKQETTKPTVESQAWPEQADILALVRGGIPYDEALAMSPLECDKTLAILSAWAIPSKERVGGVLTGTAAVDALYG